MKRFNNYLLAMAGLVILGGVIQFVMPLQAAPRAKDGDETMVITLAEDLTEEAPIEFDAVDTSGFKFVSFHVKTTSTGALRFRFSTQAGKFDDAIPKTNSRICNLSDGGGGRLL